MRAPSLSIVVPSFGRPEGLRRCLQALKQQDGGPFETLVVDDGSPEPLEPVCQEAGEWVQCIRQDNAGPAKARNRGVAAASGDFICFTDDDCLPRPGWARALHAAQGGDDTRLVGGRVQNAFPDNVFAETSQSISDWIHNWHAARTHEAQYFTSNNMGCARRTFLKIGGFDSSFPIAAAEDREFGLRWRREAGPLTYAPDALIDHAHKLDLKSFWRQQSNYGRGARHMRQVETPGASHHFEGPSFYAGLMLHPLHGRGNLPWRLSAFALSCLSQMAITSGYVAEKRRGSGRNS